MRLIPYEPHHFALMRPQEAQMHEIEHGAMSDPMGKAWTAVHDGLPVCCGGLIPVSDGRAFCWAVLDQDAGPHMLALTRAIRVHLRASGFDHIVMAVERDFEAGHRWAALLGFRRGNLAPGFLFGRDAWIYEWQQRSPT